MAPRVDPPAAAAARHWSLVSRRSAALAMWKGVLLLGCWLWLAAANELSYDDLFPVATKSLLEIVHPPNDFVLSSSDLHIEILIRDELMGGLRDSKVCISMDPVFIPEDVQLEDGPSQLHETCFEHAENYTTFHVNGLVPGLAYGITVGLVSHAKIMGISMRTFEVGSIVMPELGPRMSVAKALETGAEYHNAGSLREAANVYRQVLEVFPEHPYALHLLGLVFYQDGNPYEGYAYIYKAVQGNSSEDSFANSLGLCLKSMGKLSEAIQYFRRALELCPSSSQAALNLGDTLRAMGNWEDAMHEYRKVATSAKDAYQNPTDQFPNPEKYMKDALGRICELTRVTEGWYASEKCIVELVARFPDEPHFHNDHGHLLLAAGQFEAALQEYQSAANLASVIGMINVADTLEVLGETQESLQQYELILKSINPEHGHPETRIRIMKATVLPRILPGSQQEIDMYRQRLESEVDALRDSIETLRQADMDPSRISFSTAITMNSHNRNNRILKEKIGTLYFDLLYRYWVVRENYVLSHAMIPRPYRSVRGTDDDEPRPSAQRRLRVGFVSRFLFNPSVGLYLSDLIPALNPLKYQTIVFGVGLSGSMKKRERVDQIADHICALPKDLITGRNEIRAAKLDVLIYPELGMDKTTYFLSLSRLAPVQAVWWGNADTSGVHAMDYRLVSEYEHENFRDHYTEKELYQFKGMGIFHSFPKPHDYNASREHVRDAITKRFKLRKDFHMYLSIESILHIHPDFDEAVSEILRRDAKACIFLLGSSSRNRWRDQLVARIVARAGDRVRAFDRIFFMNDVDARQELLLAGAADAVMASIHLTRPRATIQAFTAGVPVVTLPGELWSTRIAYGFYQRMGMHDLIATSLDEYVALTLRMAQDVDFRHAMMEKIKERRSLLHEDAQAVEEWEKFLDFAGAKLFPTQEFVESDDSSADESAAQEDKVQEEQTNVSEDKQTRSIGEEERRGQEEK